MESNPMHLRYLPTDTLHRQLRAVRRLALVAVSTLMLAACTSEPPVSSAFDPLQQFPATATYVWDEAGNVLPNTSAVRETQVGQIIQNLATEALAVHGYTIAETGTPPYRLSYQLNIHTWIGTEQSTSTASLTLRLSDFVTNRTVWLGFTRIEVDLGRPVEERRAELKSTIERMLANFPPGHA
jgi:hypothetical protein